MKVNYMRPVLGGKEVTLMFLDLTEKTKYKLQEIDKEYTVLAAKVFYRPITKKHNVFIINNYGEADCLEDIEWIQHYENVEEFKEKCIRTCRIHLFETRLTGGDKY